MYFDHIHPNHSLNFLISRSSYFLFALTTHQFQDVLSIYFWLSGHPLERDQLPGDIPLKKTDSPSLRNQQHKGGSSSLFPLHVRMLTGFIWSRQHSFCDFMSTVALSCQEGTVLLWFFSSLLFLDSFCPASHNGSSALGMTVIQVFCFWAPICLLDLNP